MDEKSGSEFSKPRFIRSGPQWAESDSGFILKSAGRYRKNYIEGDHVLVIPIEHIGDPFKVIIYLSKSLKWEPPYDKELITPDKLKQIRLNIMEALNFLDTPFEVK